MGGPTFGKKSQFAEKRRRWKVSSLLQGSFPPLFGKGTPTEEGEENELGDGEPKSRRKNGQA